MPAPGGSSGPSWYESAERDADSSTGLERTLKLMGLGLLAWWRAYPNWIRPPSPVWDGERRELSFCGQRCLSLRPQAKVLVRVLEAFQDAGWPTRIPNPVGPTQLANTARDLQRKLRPTILRIERDGMGTGFCWRIDMERYDAERRAYWSQPKNRARLDKLLKRQRRQEER
jgi:hypothetical protein